MARALQARDGRCLNGRGRVLSASLRVPFRIRAATDVPAGSPVTWFQPFARGDIPHGWRVMLATASGAAVPVQQDQAVTWPGNRSLRGAALSMLTPAPLAAGEIATFLLTCAPGGPLRTPHATLAGIVASSDIRLRLSGLDLGRDAMELSFNEVVANFFEASPATGWGANPVGGWEIIRSGPICIEWLAWRYTRRADGAHHRWHKAQLYVRQWASGQREIVPVLSQPNAHQAHPTGTVGPERQTRVACYAELRDGATLLHAFGGPNDARAFTVPASAFDVSQPDGYLRNELVLPARADTYFGFGCAIGLAGALPSGLSTGAAYYPYETGEGTRTYLTTRRGKATLNDTGAREQFGTPAPSGTVTVMPAVVTFPACGLVLMTADAHPVWQGAPGRPDLLVAHDEVYLTRRTRTVPPYDLTVPRPAQANVGLPQYKVGTITGEMLSLDATGNSLDADRIGYLPVTHCASLLLPFDALRERATRVAALQWAGYTLLAEDHRSGRPVVGNNGPPGGGTYPGLGPNNEQFRMYTPGNGGVPTGWPGYGGYTSWFHDDNSTGHPGLFPGYNVPLDGSHCPDFTTVAYLRTGHHVHAMTSLHTACAVFYGIAKRRRTVGNRTYHGVFLDSGRTQGWATRSLGQAECLVPDSHPSRAMIGHVLDDRAEYYRDALSTLPTRHIGIHYDDGSVLTRPWMQAIDALCIGMEVWRGTRPAWRTLYENVALYLVDGFDDLGSSPGAGWLVNDTDFSVRDGAGIPFASIAAFNAQYGAAPFPATGLKKTEDNPEHPNSYPTILAANLAMMATNDALALANIPGAARVRLQQIKRRSRQPLRIDPYSTGAPGSPIYVMWAIVPVGA